jgi:ABC-2 type transport system ATP-binding protein
MTNTVRTTGDLAIAATALTKTYKEVTALDGLDLSVPTGAIFGLLGPNGAGKSTAVKILTTLSRADSGVAWVGGIDVFERPDEIRRAIGYVSQKHGTDDQASGLENLVLQARINGLARRTAQERVKQLLARFRLEPHAHRRVKDWSGGMRRRLDLALALVHSPKVLFLDEPTTGLDPDVRADLWDEVRRLRDEDAVTVLLTTHYLEEADQLADEIAIIDQGKVVAAGSPNELKDAMAGDGLQIELSSPDSAAVARDLLTRSGLAEVVSDGPRLHARVDRGPESVPEVLRILGNGGIAVKAVTMSRPSLDDVFLRHTGRSFNPSEMEVSA